MVQVKAVEVTKADCELRSFNFPVSWFWLPLRLAWGVRKPRRWVLGGYFSGIILQSDPNKSNLSLGDEVFGSTGMSMGAYGTQVCIPATNNLVAKPQNMSFEEAAAVPLGGLNALHFLKKAKVQQGERLLVNGAGGSIGIFAVQIAKAMGAEVTAVDAGHKEAMLLSIGADHFINYQQQDFTKMNQKYDVIFDMVARSSYRSCISRLENKGRYLLGNPRVSDMLRAGITSKFTDKEVFFAFAAEKREELIELKNLIEAGKIKSVIHEVLPMEKVVEAHHLVESEQRVGSVVINTSL
jgi:NADPH:quinone reductase-like Zn-dependent oxidoreductase